MRESSFGRSESRLTANTAKLERAFNPSAFAKAEAAIRSNIQYTNYGVPRQGSPT